MKLLRLGKKRKCFFFVLLSTFINFAGEKKNFQEYIFKLRDKNGNI